MSSGVVGLVHLRCPTGLHFAIMVGYITALIKFDQTMLETASREGVDGPFAKQLASQTIPDWYI